MPKSLRNRMLGWIDAAMATAGVVFMDAWAWIERAYRRPLARIALRLRFAFYPLVACIALGWLAWDWHHDRTLDAAEDAIFDTVIGWRPVEPRPSGRTVIVEIDDCSIEHFRRNGEGGWPWSRQRHADLVDALDRAGVRAVGFDVMFTDPSAQDPGGDAILEAMAEGGAGRFLFASSRLHAAFDGKAPVTADVAPGAFATVADPERPGPPVALMLPYGRSMAAHSALVNVVRSDDGVLRDVRLRAEEGDWALPSLPLRLAAQATGRDASTFPATIRPDWRTRTRMPYRSAADLIEGRPVCHAAGETLAPLRDTVVLVGYTAAGLNDSKPTPVNPSMPGVEVLAEATDALVAGTAIRMPPAMLKYLLAGVLVLLTTFAFWRGEPHEDVDSVFVAVNLLLLAAAFAGLTFFGTFIDIFASVGFVSLCFGLCRTYAGVQRGRAVGNNDFLGGYDPETFPWLVMARLRFVPDIALDADGARRRRREYRRRLRRFLYAGSDAVMLEGVVERKSWLHDTLDDLVVLVWKGTDEASARALARRDLDALHAHLNTHDERLDDDGRVRVCVEAAEIDDADDDDGRGGRARLRELLGRDLVSRREWPLSAANAFLQTGAAARPHTTDDGDDPCATPD